MSTSQSSKNPEVWAKVIRVAITVLTALLGFFTGTGVKAATTALFNL